jgi:protein arginine N-methyltransferase 7
MKDQIVSLRASHNLTSISYQLLNTNDEACNRSLKGDQLALLPERVALYGDRYWRSALITVVKNAVSTPVHLVQISCCCLVCMIFANFCFPLLE